MEKLIDTIKLNEAVFEVVERPETIYAGRVIYADTIPDPDCDLAIFSNDSHTNEALKKVKDPIVPERDIAISINFWKVGAERHGVAFVKETTSKKQPDGVDVFIMPSSLFIRAYTDKDTAKLLGKGSCEIFELFEYIREVIMPKHAYKMATNGAQEIESYDTTAHTTGYGYVPVMRTQNR